MRHEEIEKLLGGYATGTLTAQERKLLFEAALADQALFNALADEQALKELLDNPHARRRLLTALRVQASRPSALGRLRQWLQPPAVRMVAGGIAVAVLAVITVTQLLDTVPPPSEVTEDSYKPESTPGQGRSTDKLTTSEKDLAPKKVERHEPAVALEKTARDANVTQNKDTEPRSAADAKQEAKASQPSANVPESDKNRPAAPPVAAAPPPARGAEVKAASPFRPGARDLFYGAKQKERPPSDRPGKQASAASGLSQDAAREPAGSESRSGFSTREQLARAPVEPLGLRYSIVPRDKGAALAVEVNQRSYVYVSARDAAGVTTLVHPAPPADPQTALVEPGLRYFIPPLGALPAARLTVVLARTPLADPAALATQQQTERKDALLRQETTEPPTEGVIGTTVYVMETAPASSSTLSVEIALPAEP